MSRDHINPLQWHQAVGIARQVGARIFRDGGSPADALAQFGIAGAGIGPLDWSRAVDAIAEALCHRQGTQPMKRAA
jgi:hypothetical protein